MIGSHLCDRLVNDGHTVIGVDNYITGRQSNISHLLPNPGFSLVKADVVDTIEVGKVDQIYHLASPASPVGYMNNPIETHLVNSVGTLNLLEKARADGARFLFTSTSEIYGDPLEHPQKESYFGNVNPVGPRSCYDESKRFGESITMEFNRQYDQDVRIVRLFNVYGPRNDPNDGRVIPAFISNAINHKPLTVYGDGSQTRSLCYVSDLVSGMQKTMDTDGIEGCILNLGNPDERTVLELATIINEICGSNAGIVNLPTRPDDPERRCPDISLAVELLGWKPETSLLYGLEQTVNYFIEYEGFRV